MENNNTSAEQFALALRKIGACSEAREWAEGLDYITAWNTCTVPLWMFYLINEVTPLSPIQNELLICRFAREVVHLNSDPRVLACIETREAWARGEVSDEARKAAMDNAWASTQVAAMATYTAAAWNVVRAVMEAAAEDAAEDAADAAEDTAVRVAVRVAVEAKQCDIIRELVPQPVLGNHLWLLNVYATQLIFNSINTYGTGTKTSATRL